MSRHDDSHGVGQELPGEPGTHVRAANLRPDEPARNMQAGHSAADAQTAASMHTEGPRRGFGRSPVDVLLSMGRAGRALDDAARWWRFPMLGRDLDGGEARAVECRDAAKAALLRAVDSINATGLIAVVASRAGARSGPTSGSPAALAASEEGSPAREAKCRACFDSPEGACWPHSNAERPPE